MSYGYAGKIIRINLSNENITIEKPDDKFYRTYIGAKGFAAYYLLKELPPGIDPLSPENKLIFATGILTGVPVAAMPRFVVSAKSPLTDGYGQSEAGGYWGPELKRAGYDGIIIEGKASKPVYLYINNNHIEIRNAEHIWGKEMAVAQDTIRRELGDHKIRIAMIGPGGENLVRYACIINELKHANGRNGLGAVMGSKNLKAVAVRGTKDVSFADPEKITEIRTNTIKTYMNHPLTRTLYDLGTSSAVMSLNAGGILPTQNFVYGEMKSADNISGETLEKTTSKKGKDAMPVPYDARESLK